MVALFPGLMQHLSSLVHSPPPQLSSLAVCVIHTASNDGCGRGLGIYEASICPLWNEMSTHCGSSK